MIALQPSYLPFPGVLDVYVEYLSSKRFTGLKRANMDAVEGLPDTDDCHRHEPSQAIAEVWLYGLKKDKAGPRYGSALGYVLGLPAEVRKLIYARFTRIY